MQQSEFISSTPEAIGAGALIAFFDNYGLALSEPQKMVAQRAFRYAATTVSQGSLHDVNQPSLFDLTL